MIFLIMDLKNYKTNNAFWGPNKYRFCSDKHGTLFK